MLPYFPKKVKNVTVTIGQNAELKCEVDNLNNYKVSIVGQDKGHRRRVCYFTSEHYITCPSSNPGLCRKLFIFVLRNLLNILQKVHAKFMRLSFLNC